MGIVVLYVGRLACTREEVDAYVSFSLFSLTRTTATYLRLIKLQVAFSLALILTTTLRK